MSRDTIEYPPNLVLELEELAKVRQFPDSSMSPRDLQSVQDRIDEIVAELKAIPSPRRGDVIAGSSLVRIIGKGNFGAVWEAIDQVSGSPRAVKMFDSDRLGLGLSLYYFRRGVRAMAHLMESPLRPDSIIRLYSSTESGLAFSMQYVDGHDISNLAKRGWSLPKKLDVFKVVCEAVAFAHRQGVVHRDLKPANIVLTKSEQPVLTDFDIADLLFLSTLSTHASGTIAYAAPEQLGGEGRRDASGDIYSLGRLLHYFLAERDPEFIFENIPELRSLHGQPEGLVRIIRRSTLRDPGSRYESVEMLLHDLERYDKASHTVGVGIEGAEPDSVSAELYQMLYKSGLGNLFEAWDFYPTPKAVLESRNLNELFGGRVEVTDRDGELSTLWSGGPPYRIGQYSYRASEAKFKNLRRTLVQRVRAGGGSDADQEYLHELLRERDAPAPRRAPPLQTAAKLDLASPTGIIRAAIRAVPAVKWALGVGGVASTIALVSSIGLDPTFAAVGTVVMLFLMTLLLLFARASTHLKESLQLPALTLTWFFLILFMLTALMLFTGVFFEWPISLRRWLE